MTEQQIASTHASTLGTEQVEATDRISAPCSREHKTRIQIGSNQHKPTEEQVNEKSYFSVKLGRHSSQIEVRVMCKEWCIL